jgi:nicotinamidase/pyrazinamidase
VKKTSGSALLIVDMLNDFVLPGAPLEVPAARDIIPAIKRRIEDVRREGIPVIYLCDGHATDDPEFKIWPEHALRGTGGAQVVDELRPDSGDTVVLKTTYSAFYGTDLERILREMKGQTVTIAGILTNICVFFTAADAVMRGFRVRVARDGVAALTDEEHAFALDQMEKVLRVKLI